MHIHGNYLTTDLQKLESIGSERNQNSSSWEHGNWLPGCEADAFPALPAPHNACTSRQCHGDLAVTPLSIFTRRKSQLASHFVTIEMLGLRVEMGTSSCEFPNTAQGG